MNKKSQITAFIIVGIIVLIAGGIVVYVRTYNVEKQQVDPGVIQEVPIEANAITIYIRDCINQKTQPLLIELGKSGGTLNHSYTYRPYPGITYTESVINPTTNELVPHYYPVNYTYFCIQQGNFGCVNSLVTRDNMEEELNKAIKEELDSCINLDQFRDKGYDVEAGLREIRTTISAEQVEVILDFPLKISRGDSLVEISEVSSNIKSDLGKLYDLAVNIANNEIIKGYFDQDEWMREQGGEVGIEKHKPYPDIIYSLYRYNSKTSQELTFNFAVGGEDTVSLIGQPTSVKALNPYCNMPDGRCYANAKAAHCAATGGISSATPDCNAVAPYFDGCITCNDCGVHKHGESWCVYDSIVGGGYDYVGSRHYKQTCINGKIFDTECRDFREEICTEDNSVSPSQAVCRVNRWQDCAEQTNQNNCEDSSKRDCEWSPWLVDETSPAYGLQRPNRRCHPEVPPGFRFWEGKSEEVCNVANEWARCEGLGCPLVWTEAVMQYCYFQGDCGDYRNIADNISITHWNYEKPREYIYLEDGLIDLADSPDNKLNLPLNTRYQNTLNGDEFDNPEGSYGAIINAANDWFAEASTWEVCDFCDCIGDTPTGDCVFDETVFSAVMCRPWAAPYKGDDCDKCGEDSLKPCTEYRCKSLGSKCVYNYDAELGLGECYEYSVVDSVGPEISYDGSILGDFSVEADTLLGISADGYWLCNGDTCDDEDGITDGMSPYYTLLFVVNLSEEAQCKLSPLPNLDFNQIPSFGVGGIYDTVYPIVIRVSKFEDVKKQFLKVSQFNTILELAKVENIEKKLTEIKDNAIEIAEEFDQPIDETSLNAALEQFKSEALPLIENFYMSMGSAIREILLQMEMRNALVFLRCQDRAGNQNERQFFVKYTIGEDKTYPVIWGAAPLNETVVPGAFKLILSLNEPAVCKYSLDGDNTYDTMEHTMDCATSEFDVNFGLYECTTVIPNTPSDAEIHIKCADQPPITRRYNLHLLKSTNFSVAYSDYKNMLILKSNYVINVTYDLVLRNNNTKINVKTDKVQLNLFLDEKSQCRYADSYVRFEDMNDSLSCTDYGDEYLCSHLFDGIIGDKSFYIGCRDAEPAIPNINDNSYFLKYFRT